jgi:hypothetical protein
VIVTVAMACWDFPSAHCVTFFQTTKVKDTEVFRIHFGKYKREDNDELVQVNSETVHDLNLSYESAGAEYLFELSTDFRSRKLKKSLSIQAIVPTVMTRISQLLS